MSIKRPSLFALLALGAIVLASWDISRPALYYDETLFANAALGCHSNDFLRLRIGGVPILLLDYIGALKAWIYHLIFAFFPVSAWSIRLPAVIFGVGGSAALVSAEYRLFGRSAALVAAALLFFDPSILMLSRLDWGPDALMFLFRGLALSAVAWWWYSGRPAWAWFALAAVALGIFDKLNFIWIGWALAGGLVLTAPGRIRHFAQRHAVHFWLLLVSVAGLLAASSWRAAEVARQLDFAARSPWAARWPTANWLIRLTIVGGGPLDFVAGNGMRLGEWMWPAYGIGLVAALLGVRAFRQSAFRQAWLFCAVVAILVTAALIVTPGATGPHHAAVIAGFPQTLLSPLIAWIIQQPSSGATRWRRHLAEFAVVGLGAAMIAANIASIAWFREPTNSNWDPANVKAAEFAVAHPQARFRTADWGMGMQIIALSRGHASLNDNWPEFTDPPTARGVLRNLDRSRNTYVLCRLPGFQNFPAAYSGLMDALKADGIAFRGVLTLLAVNGRPMIQILEIPALPGKKAPD